MATKLMLHFIGIVNSYVQIMRSLLHQ